MKYSDTDTIVHLLVNTAVVRWSCILGDTYSHWHNLSSPDHMDVNISEG